MRTVILLMDSFGIGNARDAEKYGDKGADTLGHICEWFAKNPRSDTGEIKPLYLPHLAARGLAKAAELARGCPLPASLGSPHRIGGYTYAEEVSLGKDTLSGHWEITGVPVKFSWGYFPDKRKCFPRELVKKLVKEGGLLGVLGECHASGTEIIRKLGEEHVRTGKPIIYTSADSVLQIAAHEEAFGLERLYDLCTLAFELVRPYNIARVIARPFVGTCAADFTRTSNRHDYAVPAPEDTLLDKVRYAGREVYAVGKIADIFAHRGISRHYPAGNLESLIDATARAIRESPPDALVFSNFVDFDSQYGHRRDIEGYGKALEYFDRRLPEMTVFIHPRDLLVITADHGNDPSWKGTDHTRERIPVLMCGARIMKGQLAPMETFADIGQTIANYMNVAPTLTGTKAAYWGASLVDKDRVVYDDEDEDE